MSQVICKHISNLYNYSEETGALRHCDVTFPNLEAFKRWSQDSKASEPKSLIPEQVEKMI